MAEADAEEPKSKKLRVNDVLKRSCADEAVESIKRLCVSTEAECKIPSNMGNDKAEATREREKALAVRRRRNFLTACERVSYDHFSDHRRRFLLLFPPSCAVGECLHSSDNKIPSEIASYAKEAFRIDYKSHMWCDALHVAQMALRPDAVLSSELLLYIIEIILNAHPDLYSGFTIPYLLDRCHQILTLVYRTHPPCVASIRKCYKNFLMSALSVKDGTLSDRSQFDCEKGVMKYCISRLEYELKPDSKDGPLINRNDYITEEMKQTLSGLQWQKDKLDIFETLDRPDRIKRLIVVLKSLVELLTSDLSIWLSRHTYNQGRHIMRSHRPLLTFVLWSDNILYTGAVNNNCRQIINLFVKFIHLGYPEKDIEVMTQLLNTMVQTFYICETNSSGDYPHTGKYCMNFAGEIFKALKDLPTNSRIDVLTKIQPTFMRHLVGVIYIQSLLKSKDDDILMIMKDFLDNQRWKKFTEKSSEKLNLSESKLKNVKKVHRIYSNFSKAIRADKKSNIEDFMNGEIYPKFNTEYNDENSAVSQEQIIRIVLVTLDAYLEAYSIEKFQDKLDQMNNRLFDQEIDSGLQNQPCRSYTLSEEFYKKYRSIYQIVNEIKYKLKKLKGSKDFEYFEKFETLILLGV